MSAPLPPRGSWWLVCETTGRWAAALRLAITRKVHEVSPKLSPRHVREFRVLAELEAVLQQGSFSHAFVEVRRENLGAVLDLLSSQRHKDMPLVALLDESVGHDLNSNSSTAGNQAPIIDALFEAGATDVIKTPRQIGRFLAAAAHQYRASSCLGDKAREYSITELAWNALPWQDD
jgi:hypothetical protein